MSTSCSNMEHVSSCSNRRSAMLHGSCFYVEGKMVERM